MNGGCPADKETTGDWASPVSLAAPLKVVAGSRGQGNKRVSGEHGTGNEADV